jgi:hypothetical protein
VKLKKYASFSCLLILIKWRLALVQLPAIQASIKELNDFLPAIYLPVTLNINELEASELLLV